MMLPCNIIFLNFICVSDGINDHVDYWATCTIKMFHIIPPWHERLDMFKLHSHVLWIPLSHPWLLNRCHVKPFTR